MMTSTRARLLRLFLAGPFVGSVCVATGAFEWCAAADGLVTASGGASSRIRELDSVIRAAHDPLRRADVLPALDEALAMDPAEAAAFAHARECASATGCPEGIDAALEPARHDYETRLASAWTACRARRRRAVWIVALGLVVCLGCLAGTAALVVPADHEEVTAAEPPPQAGAGAIGLIGRMRVGRTLAATTGSGPLQPSSSMEQVLRQRLEELYAIRLRAWQTDRFAAYGELAAGLSHGLKTPLAGIRAAAQVVQMQLGPDHPAAAQMDDIVSETDSLVEQVRRFLSATGSGAPVPARIRPGQLVEALDRDYAGEAARRGLTWKTAVEQGLDELWIDPALVEMACRNLVENAMAATPRGSAVELTARSGQVPERAGLDDAPAQPGRWVELAIRDEGPGIPKRVLAGQRVVSEKPDGSGLGMAIARRIIARHGGAIVFEPGCERGTVVRVLLPAAPEITAGGRA